MSYHVSDNEVLSVVWLWSGQAKPQGLNGRRHSALVLLTSEVAGGSGGALSEKLPHKSKLEVIFKKGKKGKETVTTITHLVTGAIELHRLAVLDFEELQKRKDEITEDIVNATCSYDDGHTEVMKSGWPTFITPFRSRHCFLPASTKYGTLPFCFWTQAPTRTRQ